VGIVFTKKHVHCNFIMTKPNAYILLGTIFLFLTWFFVGLYRDDEFNEPNFFIKYKPTFKVNFYSPIGMQDLKLNSLTPEKKMEEIAFQEFVTKQHIQSNSNTIVWYLPFILIQMTVTFFSFGYFKIRRKLVYNRWQLPAHFSTSLAFTSLGLCFILAFDNLILTFILLIILVFINYLLFFLFTKKNQHLV
jgi:hypothetical protein